MLLKRNYDIPEGWEPERDAHGNLTNPLPVKSLTLKHTGVHPEQNFSRRLIDGGLQEGWLSLGHGQVVLHTEQGDLHYTVNKVPGSYCCFCDAKLDDDTTGTSGREHVREFHEGAESPDPSNPMGFRVTNAYECTLDADEHAKWMRPAYATVSNVRWKEVQPTSTSNGHTAQTATATAPRRAQSAPQEAPAAEAPPEG